MPVIGYRQTATLLNGNTTVTVTLDHSFADANYVVSVEMPHQTSFWITNKTSTNFVLNVGTAPTPYDVTINFWIFHE